MPCKKILVIVSFEKNRGTGHFVRGKHIVRGLRELGCEAYLCVYTSEGRPPAGADLEDCRRWLISKDNILQNWTFIIFDRFATLPAEFEAAFSLAPLIALDEGGPLRDAFDFVLDILPNKPSVSRPNVLYCGLLPLPANRRPDFPQAGLLREGRARILVSFGGEDAARLGGRAAAALRAALPNAEITLIQGASGGTTAAPDGVTVKEPEAALRETFAGCDLVVTHYGLTAYEAAYARTAVLLVSPSKLHHTLGREAGFFDAGLGGAGIKRLERLFKRPAFFETLVQATQQTAEKYGLELTQKRTLAEHIYYFDVYAFRTCPVCGKIVHSSRKIAARFPEQTFVVCPHCSMIIQNRLRSPPIEYNEKYFFEMYKEQYGKTYIEDFPNLIAMSNERLRIISTIRKDSNRIASSMRRPALLDIGCAYGAFLCAAQKAGFAPFGIDASQEAVAYINKELYIPARMCHFPDDFTLNIFPKNCFDCVTMWFVIEHLQDVPTALKRARSLLRPGGIFAFSTPSASGISARTSLVRFLAKSPADHWAVWKPEAVSRLLGRFGFTVKKIRITGRHPERFPLIGRFAKNGSLLYRALLVVSGIFKLGDTFEVYAVKSGSPL